jgi:hypothetical protein
MVLGNLHQLLHVPSIQIGVDNPHVQTPDIYYDFTEERRYNSNSDASINRVSTADLWSRSSH